MWVVGHHGCVPNHPRFFLLLGLIPELQDRGQSLASDLQSLVSMASAPCFVPDRHSVGETAPGEVILPPFAGLKAEVSFGLEQTGQGGEVLDPAGQLLASVAILLAGVILGGREPCGTRWVVADDSVLMGVFAGDQGRQTWAAQAGRNIAARKAEAFGCESVEVRSADDGMPHESEIRPGLIIRDDEQQIWAGGGVWVGWGCGGGEGEPGRSEGQPKDESEANGV